MCETKDYIVNRYKLVLQDYNLARNEDMRWECCKELAKLQLLASSFYGFDFADSLKRLDKQQ